MNEAARASLATLEHVPGLQVDVLREGESEDPTRIDATVEVRSRAGVDRYGAEAKRHVTMSTLPSILSHLQRRQDSKLMPLLLTDYVSPTVAQALQAQRIAFADAAGNVYLEGPAAYIWITGHRPSQAPPRSGLTATDLKLTFALLRQPDLLQRPLRTIAHTTGVSLGKVSTTLRTLELQKYLARRRGPRWILQDAHRLLERWELGYLEVLRPRLRPTNWRLAPAAVFEEILGHALRVPDALIGGEHAADAFTHFLKPATITLHVPPGETKRVATDLRLRPGEHPHHQVVLLERFATPLDEADVSLDGEASNDRRLVHPLLARVELLAHSSDRLREVADRLLDEVILPAFPHDG